MAWCKALCCDQFWLISKSPCFLHIDFSKLGERAIKKGDEVITVAAGFPTTVNPIIQFGAIPVFVDVCLPGFDIDVNQLEAAYSPKCKAVMMAHSLGNPFNLKAVLAFCEKHNLWLIEDNCDALGSEYTIDGVTKRLVLGDILVQVRSILLIT